jgi:hypothetical protein
MLVNVEDAKRINSLRIKWGKKNNAAVVHLLLEVYRRWNVDKQARDD